MSKFVEFIKNSKKAFIALCIALALVIVGSLFGALTQTDFFNVSIETKTITIDITDNKESTADVNASNSYSNKDASATAVSKAKEAGKFTVSVADIYRPKYASFENPVPMVLVAPGIQRTKETQATFCIELVRRGYGVICLDPYGQGESTPSYESQSATREGYGLFHWMDYMHTAEGLEYFDWVDYSKIGATGHSAGGNGAQKLAEREGRIAAELGKNVLSRLSAVYITGYIRGWNWNNTRCNIGISYSKNDEGAFQNETAIKKNEIQAKLDAGQTLTEKEQWWLTVGNADMRYAPESIEIVNYQLGRAGQPSIDEVVVGEGYGNPYTNTYAIINNEACLHAFQPYDSATLSNMVGFFGYVFENSDADGLQRGLKDSNHIWALKEVGGLMMLGGAFTFILALMNILLKTKAFKSLKKEIPQRTAKQSTTGKILFWVFFAVSAVIACVLYMVAVQKSVDWFPDAASSVLTWNFPQRFTNAIMIWAVLNGLIGIGIFFGTWGLEYAIDRRRAIKDGTDYSAVKKAYISKLEPLKLKGSDIWKTPLMAAILIVSFFALNALCYAIFHVDFRFFFLSVRFTLNPNAVGAMLMYIPFFFIFYMSNSLRVNCGMRPSNWGEGVSKVISVLGNTLGLLAIMFIQYIPFITNGTIGYTGTVGPQWLFVNMLFSIIPMMAALPLFNRYFFNKTGRAWLGAMVICTIFIIMTGSGTTIYYAL